MTDCPNSWLMQQEIEKLTFSSELCAFSCVGGRKKERDEINRNSCVICSDAGKFSPSTRSRTQKLSSNHHHKAGPYYSASTNLSLLVYWHCCCGTCSLRG